MVVLRTIGPVWVHLFTGFECYDMGIDIGAKSPGLIAPFASIVERYHTTHIQDFFPINHEPEDFVVIESVI